MNTGVRMVGIRSVLLAAGIALAGIGTAGAQAPATAPVAANAAAPAPAAAAPAAPQGAAQSAAVNTAPTTAAATPTADPTSPLLAQDGAPAMAIDPLVGHPVDGAFSLQPQVTRNGNFAHWFHDRILFPMTAIISLFVLALLVWVVLRYRQAANPTPSRTSHNTVIEVIWTLAPVAALVAIAVPSIGLLQAQFKPAPAGAVTLKAIGNQWYWSYQYPDNGGFEITANMLKEKGEVNAGDRARIDADGPRLLAADNRVVLPVGVPIRLITTSNDVIHSWAMPAFWIKLDAVPGRLNETSFTIDKPGLYFGQCSELCGARHAFMPIAVEAVPQATFAAWVRAKGGTMPSGPAKPSNKVIPQPGADLNPNNGSDAATQPATENGALPTEQPVNQRATGNPAGAGNAGL